MKPIIIVASLLALAATAIDANAGKAFTVLKPCESKCQTEPIVDHGLFTYQNFHIVDPDLLYESRSQSVFTSSSGRTSIINSTYRTYRR